MRRENWLPILALLIVLIHILFLISHPAVIVNDRGTAMPLPVVVALSLGEGKAWTYTRIHGTLWASLAARRVDDYHGTAWPQ